MNWQASKPSADWVPRGAGSGVAGEALGAGLIIDLSRHFRSILEIGSDNFPGVGIGGIA